MSHPARRARNGRVLGSSGRPRAIDTKIVPQFVGVFDKDDALVCQRVTFEKPTSYGLSLAVVESLSYGKDAIDRAREMPAAFDKSRDMMTLMTELMRIGDAHHVRNAVARLSQVEAVTDEKRDEAWKRILAAARKFGLAVQESSWRELKPR